MTEKAQYITLQLGPDLLQKRQAGWEFFLRNPHENPLLTRPDFSAGEVLIEREPCVYTRDARFSDGLPFSGPTVPRRLCQTELGFTPHIRGKRPNVPCFAALQVRVAQSRFLFHSLCSEKQFGYPNYFSKPYKTGTKPKGKGVTMVDGQVA